MTPPTPEVFPEPIPEPMNLGRMVPAEQIYIRGRGSDMAVIESIPIGPIVTLLQNVVYALPALNVTLYTDDAAAALQTSITPDFSTSTAVTIANGERARAVAFIRSTGTTCCYFERRTK